MNSENRLIVALDVSNDKKALAMVEMLKGQTRIFKVGLELFSAAGPDIISKIKGKDCKVFLDLKLHDIPNTVAKAAVVLTRLGIFMFNVHALGGYDMMKKTKDAVETEANRLKVAKPKILAVTILTSMDENGLKKIGISDSIQTSVLKLANDAKSAGLDGVVASPSELKELRRDFGKDFLIVTPGVRPSWAEAGDQKRIATPGEAIKDGASFIVIGRPIIEAPDPLQAARKILEEIKA